MEGYRKSDALVGSELSHPRSSQSSPDPLELEHSGSTRVPLRHHNHFHRHHFLRLPLVGLVSSPPVDPLTRSQLGQTYFDGLHNDPESVERLKNKYNYHSSNLLLLRFGNC
jgi:hypothetical protein